MTRQPVTAEDLIRSATDARAALSRISPDAWPNRPPNMEWTRLITASHIGSALLAYATNLASGTTEPQEVVRPDESDLSGDRLPALIRSQSNLLAAAARSAPPGTRGFHGVGHPDAEGYLAMGCTEILLHTWDVMAGTGIEFVGDEGVADRVLRRLLPWSPTDTPRWRTLLFATGRGELEGYDSPGERWMWHNDLLEEWDGNEKRSDHWVGRI